MRASPSCSAHRHTLARAVWGLLCLAVLAGVHAAFARNAPTVAKSPTASTQRPPNVLMIVSDDQAWTDFGFMGHKVIRTPHLDRLAAESAVFPNGYVPTSLCRASLATLITGQYAYQHRICCNDPPDGIDRSMMLPFMRQAPALPRLLGQHSYRSLQTGKWWEGHYANGGFTHGMTTRGRHGEEGLAIGRQTLQPIRDFIKESGDKPWFIWYAPMMPHEPHNPPERLLAKYRAPGRDERLAKYWAMCEWFDETCGEVLGYLDEAGLRQDTLVVFVVDNGWIQETGGVRRTRGNFAPKSKLSPYDGGVRTPILIRWPNRIKAGRHEDLVSTIDLAPTLLAACGLQPSPQMHGLSLLDVATGNEKSLPRDAVFGEMYVHTAVQLFRPSLSLTHRWVREKDWKLIAPVEGPAELYHVRRDPHEEKNLALEQPDRVQQLRQRLDAWWLGR